MMISARQKSHLTKLFLKIVVFFAIGVSYVFSSLAAEASTLSVSPQTGVYTVGGTFAANVIVDTQGAPINAAEGMLSFDTQKLNVVSISKGSIFNLWTVEPSFSNSAGTITFGGGSPAGYTGRAGTILSIIFRTVSAGEANVSFTSGSVLAADGLGTNVLSSMGSGAFTIASAEVPAEPELIEYIAQPNTPGTPVISSNTHPGDWSANKTAKLSWSLPSGVTGVRTLLDENSGSIPTKVYDNPIDSITLTDLEDGVSYFHLQFRNEEGWGRVAHYRLGIDTQNPTRFDISLLEDADLSAPAQTLLLKVEDETSGVSRYQVSIDGAEPHEFVDDTGSSTITLPPLNPGHHSVIIEAFDGAENSIVSTFAFSILAFDKPKFTEYPTQINSEVIPVIKGVTRPNSTVTITITPVGSDASSKDYTLTSTGAGEFVFIPDSRFANGVYDLTAIAIDQHGAQSDPSDTIRIAVQDPGYVLIGSLVVSILSIFIPLLALALLLVLLVLYFLRRFRLIRGSVLSETAEALSVLKREFEDLDRVLSEQEEVLRKSRKTKKLTQAESNLIDTVKKTMQGAEKRVAKEVGEVDDIVE